MALQRKFLPKPEVEQAIAEEPPVKKDRLRVPLPIVPKTVHPRKWGQYNSEYHDHHVYLFRLLGYTVPEISVIFDVSVDTIELWCKNKPSFKQAYIDGGDHADARVAHSRYLLAVGYHIEKEIIRIGKNGLVTRVPYLEYIPPNPGAQDQWLGNRQSKRWGKRPADAPGDNVITVKVIGGLPDNQNTVDIVNVSAETDGS
jgi:hypothetical protein